MSRRLPHLGALMKPMSSKRFGGTLSPGSLSEAKKRCVSREYVMWPSSLQRAGHTRVELTSRDSTLVAVQDLGIQVGCGVELPCKLIRSSKFRNGAERLWCPVHQGSYGRLAQVRDAKFTGTKKCDQAHDLMDFVKESDVPVFNTAEYSDFKASLALPPAFDTSTKTKLFPGINVSATHREGTSIDQQFSAIYIKDVPSSLFSPAEKGLLVTPPEKGLLVTPPPALELLFCVEAFSASKNKGLLNPRVPVKLTETIRCKHCKSLHEDVGEYFGQNYHKKHLCGQCGREIFGKPNIGNPLVALSNQLERSTIQAEKTLRLDTSRDKFMLWPTAPALVYKSTRAQLRGVHVKVFDSEEKCISDDIYKCVWIDGEDVDRGTALRKSLKLLQGRSGLEL